MWRSHGATAKPARHPAIAPSASAVIATAALWALVAPTTGVSLASNHSTGASAIYLRDCARCHDTHAAQSQTREAGVAPQLPAFNDCEMVSMMSDATLFLAIKDGAAAVGAPSKMPTYDHSLSDDQIAALVAHVRKLCRARGQPLPTTP